MSRPFATLVPLAILALLGACKEKDPAPSKPERLSVEELQNPETCKSCHPTHYKEWKASMHAYASDDPVFVAMNALGQEETNGALGDFCVNCHAPMAVRAGFTDGGVLAEDTPPHLKGVTCYFCHNVESVDGDNNGQVTLAGDDIMRGNLHMPAPVEPSAHGVGASPFTDPRNPASARFCGGCHDIVNDNDVHLERTFAEYNESVFSQQDTLSFITCSGCHMPFRDGLAATQTGTGETVPMRFNQIHSHLWPGVDVAMTPWPDADKYEAAVTCALDQSIDFKEDLSGMGESGGPLYVVEIQAGHKMPSGASQDRRLWVEIIAYDANDDIVCSSGAVPEGEPVTGFQDPRAHCGWTGAGPDGELFPLYRDQIFDADGNETHMFWRAAPSTRADSGVISVALPAATQLREDGTPAPHTESIEFSGLPDSAVRATVRLKMRPMDHDVLEELIEVGLLNASIHDEVRTFTIASGSVEFRRTNVWEATPIPERNTNCNDIYFCAFDPEAPNCD